MKTNVIASVMVSGVLLGSGAGCTEMGRSEPMDKAPAAVKSAVATAVEGRKVKNFEKEDEDGKTVYEASFDVDGVEHTLTVDEAGDVVEEETEVKVADLPAAVSAAVLKAQPLARVKEAAKVKKGDKSYFEINAKVGEDKHELSINADGSLISDKVEADEGDDKDEKGREREPRETREGKDTKHDKD